MYDVTIIVGNLGKDPEMRYAPNGDAVTSMSVAVNKEYKDKDGTKVKETKWFRVEVWGKQGEACNQYLLKGSRVLVEGSLKADQKTGNPRIWTNSAGEPQASFELRASVVRFLSPASEKHETMAFPDEGF